MAEKSRAVFVPFGKGGGVVGACAFQSKIYVCTFLNHVAFESFFQHSFTPPPTDLQVSP